MKMNMKISFIEKTMKTIMATAMIAVGISPGDEVIVTPLTDMGSLIPILFQGAVPVFADLHPNTYLITPGNS